MTRKGPKRGLSLSHLPPRATTSTTDPGDVSVHQVWTLDHLEDGLCHPPPNPTMHKIKAQVARNPQRGHADSHPSLPPSLGCWGWGFSRQRGATQEPLAHFSLPREGTSALLQCPGCISNWFPVALMVLRAGGCFGMSSGFAKQPREDVGSSHAAGVSGNPKPHQHMLSGESETTLISQ